MRTALGEEMKKFVFYILAFVSLVGCSSIQDSNVGNNLYTVPSGLLGPWVIEIENLRNKLITTIVVEFSDSKADSCLGGNWRKLVVLSSSTSDAEFFPLQDSLSYEVKGSEVVIGRNEICDGYLHLSGEMVNSSVSGEYFSFGWGKENLGYFSLQRGSE